MPAGRPPKEKSFYNALSVALNQVNGIDEAGQKVTKLRSIAEKLVVAAEAGESWAIKEVADRIDGKPMQQTEITGEDGGPLLVQQIVRRIVDPKANGTND